MEAATKKLVKDAVDKYLPRAFALCCDLAEHPEISNEEFESSKKITALLGDAGFALEYPYAGRPTAFRGTFNNGAGAKAALMIEYDALPVVGHGCGHNFHGALCVLAGLALKELSPQYKGTLYVVGTPAEEIDGAKIDMSTNGVFDGLDLALMLHSFSGGKSQVNMDALSLRSYTVSFTGKSAHAVAAPWEGHSALAAARKFIDLVDARRECFTPDIKFNAIFTDGGRAVNIIPKDAELFVEFRTASIGKMAELDDTILKCARAAAMAFDCGVTWRLNYPDFSDMVRVKPLEDAMENIFGQLGIPYEEVTPPVGSTDVGNVSYRCPALQPLYSIIDKPTPLHTVDMAEATVAAGADKVMSLGAQALCHLMLQTYTDAGFRQRTNDAWKKSLGRKGNMV
jgi:amidohydrolase